AQQARLVRQRERLPPRLQAAGRFRNLCRGHSQARAAGRRDRGTLPGRHVLRRRGHSESGAVAEEEGGEEKEMSGRTPRLAAPAGAVDTAIHVYHASVPSAPGGPPVPGDFREIAYQAVQQRLGFKRVVVVQPNAYQYDHSVTLAAIRALGPGARGVGVVRPDASDAEIDRLARGGIVAQRIFQMQWGAVGFDRMHDVMGRVHPFGWFATIQLDGRELPQWEQTIRKLPGKFVIDHIGKFLEPVAPEHEA